MAGEGPTKRIILLRKNRVGQSIQDQTFRFCYCDGEKEIQAEIMRSCFGQHVIKNTNQITVPPLPGNTVNGPTGVEVFVAS